MSPDIIIFDVNHHFVFELDYADDYRRFTLKSRAMRTADASYARYDY